jgi:ubiquinone/menaquinone biosynthesis C-methylase UbiE
VSIAGHYVRTRSAFNQVAVDRQGYYDTRPGKPLRHSRWQRRVRRHVMAALQMAHDEAGALGTMLSIGCGRADFELDVATAFADVDHLVGCDFAEQALRLARDDTAGTGRFAFLAADALNLPFSDNVFDVTLCINVLHHVQASDLERVTGGIARVSRKHIIFEIKNSDQFYYRRMHPLHALGVRVFPTSAARLSALLEMHDFTLKRSFHVFGLKVLSPLSVLWFARTG